MPATDRSREESLRRPAIIAWLRMGRVLQRVGRAWRGVLREHELTDAQFDVIAQVGGHPGLTQQDLGRHLLVTEGNVSQVLAVLERRRLIERRAQGRSKRLHLTPEGERVFRAVVPRHEDWLVERFEVLTPAEQAQLLRLLQKLERGQR